MLANFWPTSKNSIYSVCTVSSCSLSLFNFGHAFVYTDIFRHRSLFHFTHRLPLFLFIHSIIFFLAQILSTSSIYFVILFALPHHYRTSKFFIMETHLCRHHRKKLLSLTLQTVSIIRNFTFALFFMISHIFT